MESVRRKLLPNPRHTANSLSILLFIWTIDLFKKGYQRTLELTDLYEPLPADRSTHLGDRLERLGQFFLFLLLPLLCIELTLLFATRNWLVQKYSRRRPPLLKALVQTFWKKFLLLEATAFCNDILIRLTQPYLLGRLLMYFR